MSICLTSSSERRTGIMATGDTRTRGV
jgi:hypothetical protein